MVGSSAENGRLPSALYDLTGATVLSFLAAGLAIVEVSLLLPLRFVLGILLALFLPGYQLVSILFPEAPSDDDPGKTLLGRSVLAIALSVVIVPLVAISLQYSGVGIRRIPVAVALAGVTALLGAGAAARRYRLPPTQRFVLDTEFPDPRSMTRWLGGADRITRVLTGLLIISLLTATAGAAYYAVDPGGEKATTEFYLLSQNRTGDYVASGYPSELTSDEPQTIGVGIANHEGHTTEYTVVVSVQRMTERSRAATVVERHNLSRFNQTLQNEEEILVPVSISVPIKGQNLRLHFALYNQTIATGSPYRETYLWVNATASDNSARSMQSA